MITYRVQRFLVRVKCRMGFHSWVTTITGLNWTQDAGFHGTVTSAQDWCQVCDKMKEKVA